MNPTARLEKTLGYQFSQPELLRQALTHRSHSSPHNERIEFLGDSVLDCVVAAMLYRRFDKLREGELSRLRATLVRQESLADIALELALGDYLLLGEGELKSGGFRRPSILADTLEAILGAIYLEAGFDTVQRIIEQLYHSRLDQLDPSEAGKDPKTALQEWLQARRLPTPLYSLATTRGEAHAQEFEVTCEIASANLKVAGTGSSRRNAEQQAAQVALDRLKAS